MHGSAYSEDQSVQMFHKFNSMPLFKDLGTTNARMSVSVGERTIPKSKVLEILQYFENSIQSGQGTEFVQYCCQEIEKILPKIRVSYRSLSSKDAHLTLTKPAFWVVSHGPGGGLPCYLTPEVSERLVINMTFDAYLLIIFLRCSTFL